MNPADPEYSVFHAFNNHTVTQGDVIYAMKDYGFDIEIVPDEVFRQTLSDAARSGTSGETLLGLVAYEKKGL